MDLTIPSFICKDHAINDGDLFLVEIVNEEPIKLLYTCVYKQD